MANPLKQLSRGVIARISTDLAAKSKTAQRALPDSKGDETAKQQQTYRTEIYSYFTVSSAETQLLYSAENWVRIKLALQTAGPVAVGSSAELTPVLSGRGILLDPDVPFEAYLAKGTRIYVTSETVNRINVTIEPVPWFEQIDTDMNGNAVGVRNTLAAVGSSIVDAINALRGLGAGVGAGHAASSSGMTATQQARLPLLPSGGRIPRLPPMTMPKKHR